MSLWSIFRRAEPELTADELRQRMVEAAATGSARQITKFCKRHRDQISRHIEALRVVPEHLRADAVYIDRYMSALVPTAQCLASQFGDPRLLQALIGTEENNPILRWDRLLHELPQLLQDLQYDEAETRLRDMLAQTEKTQGTANLRYAVYARGNLGQCFFHQGRVSESKEQMEQALQMCRDAGDAEGVLTYLHNLIDVERFLGVTERAATRCDEFAAELLRAGHKQQAAKASSRAALIRSGEPLNRVIVHSGDETMELDEVTPRKDAHFQFVFERNRPRLNKTAILTQRACELAGNGELAAAQELFEQAAEVDPHDPDPVFQSAVCLMEMGVCDQAVKHLDNVERLAPGWFQSRSDRWLAGQIAEGALPHEAFMVLRHLQDANLPLRERLSLCRQSLDRFPQFAPLWLVYGNARRDEGRNSDAERAYRTGLSCAAEPDVQARLAVALAAILPADHAERASLLEQAQNPGGNLIAAATARMIGLMAKA